MYNKNVFMKVNIYMPGLGKRLAIFNQLHVGNTYKNEYDTGIMNCNRTVRSISS